jgi:hypothetical protein
VWCGWRFSGRFGDRAGRDGRRDVTRATKSGAERQRAYLARKRAEKAAAQAQLAREVPQQPALFDAGGAEPAPAAGAARAKWRAYCQQRFGSTLVARAQMAQWAASMSLGDLAKALGCDTLTAWRELGAALDAVTPFLHARAPVDAGETPQGAIQVIIAPALAAALDAEDARTIDIPGTQVARHEG